MDESPSDFSSTSQVRSSDFNMQTDGEQFSDNEIKDSRPEEIEKIYSKFNEIVGVSTDSLKDVLEIVDVLSQAQFAKKNQVSDPNEENNKLKVKISNLKKKNHNLIAQLQKSESINSSLQNSIDQLSIEKQRNQEALLSMEKRLTTAHQEISDLKKQQNNLSDSRKALNDSLTSLSDLLQSQIEDSSKLMDQRNELVNIINKQNLVIQTYESQLSNFLESHKNLKRQNKNQGNITTESDIPIALISIVKICNNLYSKFSSSIEKIINDSNITFLERINKIITFICDSLNQYEQEKKDLITEKENLNEKLSEIQTKCLRILSMYSEEIKFLQSIAHSNDLQSCIFYRPETATTIQMDKDTKNELIQHCIRVSNYIEETIPELNINEISNAFEQFEKIDPTEIFDLMSANKLEKKLNEFLKRMESNESQDFYELFYIFSAQAFINDILQNHAIELRTKYDYIIREIKQKNLDEEQNIDTIKSMKKIIKHLQHQQNKAIRILSKYFNINDDTNILSFAKKLMENIEQNNIQHPEAKHLQKQLNEIVTEKEKMTDELNYQLEKTEEAISNSAQAYQQTINDLNTKINQLTNDLEDKNKHNEELQNLIQDTKTQLENTTNELKQQKEIFDSSIQQYKENYENQLSQLQSTKNKCQELEKNIEKATNIIENLRKEKKEHKNRIELLENINLKSIESLREKSKALREQYEREIHQMQAKFEITQQENENFKNEKRSMQATIEELTLKLHNLNISKKSTELKLKSQEDKFEGQKQTIIMQYATKLKSIESQYQDKINYNNEEETKLINEFIDNANMNLRMQLSYIDLSPLNIKIFLNNLTDELNKKSHTQEIYENTVTDLLKVQKLLKLDESDEIFEPINKLLLDYKQLKKSIKKYKNNYEETTKQIQDLYKEIRKAEGKIYSLNQWENWGRKLHNVLLDVSCTTYSSNQLRLSLEEAILSSTSNKKVLLRLISLRQQKNLLLKFDKDLMKHKENVQPSWNSTMAVIICCCKLMKLSGSLFINKNAPSSISSSSPAKNHKAKKVSVERLGKYPKFSIFNV